MKKLPLLLLSLTVTLSSTALSAQDSKEETDRPTWIERIFGTREDREAAAEARKKAKEEAEEAEQEAKENKDKGFTKKERAVLEEWQKESGLTKEQYRKLPPGLQKKVNRGGELPPGWKKKLEIGETLDPEVAEQARKVPEEILKRFPEIEEGIEILEVGGEIIKVVEDSLEIIDILSRGETKD